MNADRHLGRRLDGRLVVACALLVSGLLLAGCSKSEEKPPASQVVAKVNKKELTIHQLNFLLEQQRGLKADQVELARKQALERLVDEELAIQKASELKLDRDPRVMQQIEASRRDIIARAYFDRVGDGASKPSETEIHKYYADHPALFADRRVYQLQEWFVEVPEDRAEAVRVKARSSKAANDFTDYLKSSSLKFEFNQAVRAAEQLPLSSLETFAKMRDGETMINTRPNGLQVITLVTSRREPVDLSRVRPAVEKFLMNEQKTRIIADDLKALRMAAAIRYVGSASFDGTDKTTPAQPSGSSPSAVLGDASVNTAMGSK